MAQRLGPGEALADRRLADQPAQEPQVRHEAQDDGLVERALEAGEGGLPILARGDDLGQQGIEPRPDLRADRDPRIDADALTGREARAPRRGRSPAGSRSRRPRRRAGPRPRGLPWPGSGRPRPGRARVGQPGAARDRQLVRHEIAARDGLGDRVLDLEPRVHLEEVGVAVVGDEELAGAGAPVAHGGGRRSAASVMRGANLRIEGGRRGLLEHLLVAALERAVALAEVDAVAMGIEQDLDLDVARALEVAARGSGGRRRRRSRPRAGRRRARRAGREVADDPHALAATARRRLDDERARRSASRPSRGPCRTGRRRRSRAASRRRAPRRGGARRPCRPWRGSPKPAARPSGCRPPRPPRRTRPARRGSRSRDGARRPRRPGGRDHGRAVEEVDGSGPSMPGRPSGCPGDRRSAGSVSRSRPDWPRRAHGSRCVGDASGARPSR